MSKKPYLLNINAIGDAASGFLNVVSSNNEAPFAIQRIFWTYDTPPDVVRGKHAHYKTEMILFAIRGVITLQLESKDRVVLNYTLDDPTIGLYIPTMYWHTIKYAEGAIQLVLASTAYDEEDYIRDYNTWITI